MGVPPSPAATPPGRHGPETVHRAAHRARAIFDAGPRTELAGAAEFLHALLRVPDERSTDTAGDVG